MRVRDERHPQLLKLPLHDILLEAPDLDSDAPCRTEVDAFLTGPCEGIYGLVGYQVVYSVASFFLLAMVALLYLKVSAR